MPPLGFHPLQLIVILVIALLIFGPKRLPEMGASIGKSIQAFKKGMEELKTPEKPTDQPAVEPGSITRRAASLNAADVVANDVTQTKID